MTTPPLTPPELTPPRLTPARAVPLRDTPQLYGKVSRLLHWLMAALILWQLLGMGLRLIFGRQPFVSFFVGSHQMVGTVIFALVVLRVIWALANRGSRPAHGAGLIGIASRLGHLALYLLMFAVPLLAIIRSWGSTRGFAPFGFTIFPPQAEEVVWATSLGSLLHGELAWVMAALIAGHVLMVGVHQAMWRDGTLFKMAGRRRAG